MKFINHKKPIAILIAEYQEDGTIALSSVQGTYLTPSEFADLRIAVEKGFGELDDEAIGRINAFNRKKAQP